MLTDQEPAPTRDQSPPPARYAGGALLLGVLGVSLMMIGVMLIAMLQAPVLRPKAIVTGFVLIVMGIVVVVAAWVRRKPPR